MEIIVILVWLGCAYWCSQIAKQNGRNQLIATVAGLLFGVIAVILYYIAGEDKSKN